MKYTNNLNLPQAFVNAVIDDDYDSQGDISVTALIGPPRMYWLKKRHDKEITVDVSSKVYAIYGKAIHFVMEKNLDENSIVEERLKDNILGWVVTGQPDLFTETEIFDFKITSAWVIIYDSNKDNYAWQLNFYRYLAHKSGFDGIKKLSNVMLLRDWSRTKAMQDSGYPQLPIETIVQPLYSLEEVKTRLTERVKLFQECKDFPDDKLPMCTEQERWQRTNKYALMKTGRKSAIKLCNGIEEADMLLRQKYKGADDIVFRRGESIRCSSYCECREFCSFYKENADLTSSNEEE